MCIMTEKRYLKHCDSMVLETGREVAHHKIGSQCGIKEEPNLLVGHFVVGALERDFVLYRRFLL